MEIAAETDIVTARTTIREVVTDLGFGLTDTTRIVTAVSELARNVHRYAEGGTMAWEVRTGEDRPRIDIVFDDDGPGIGDLEAALAEGHSSAEGMGHGLPGARKLMDEFDIETSAADGTTVTVRKYLP